MLLKMALGFCSGSFFFAAFLTVSVSAQETLTLEEKLELETGRALFEKIWVSSPASTKASDGLGPYYNARSCAQCHVAGGKGSIESSLVLHVNDETYGQQIQTFAIPGLPAEARLTVAYRSTIITLSEGEKVELQVPEYSLSDFEYGLMQSTSYSPRIATSLAGLGLIEMIPYHLIEELVDEEDEDEDGVSGRMNYVWDEGRQEHRPGRFGWKAGQASIAQQTAKALNLDIGISSPLYPGPYGDCTLSQLACLEQANGSSPAHENLEASSTLFASLLLYTRNIPAPVRASEADQKGEVLFSEAGCAACHHPGFEVLGRLIEPYSDFLLHDMGDDLAGGSEGLATDEEWRTAPLWGMKAPYMHDGRAKTLPEAILWHGGEAQSSLDRYQSMPKAERDALIRFLNSI